MALTGPMTELEAVNQMLQMVGEAPVNSIPSSGLSEAIVAKSTLDEVCREVQAVGLHCNTDTNYSLVPNVDGEIHVPSTAISVDASNAVRDVVIRGSRLYDRDNKTFTFTAPIECDITWLFPFTDLPQAARKYIQVKSARKFLAETVGAESLYAQTEKQEFEALAAFKRAELLTHDISMLDSSNVRRTISRRYI